MSLPAVVRCFAPIKRFPGATELARAQESSLALSLTAGEWLQRHMLLLIALPTAFKPPSLNGHRSAPLTRRQALSRGVPAAAAAFLLPLRPAAAVSLDDDDVDADDEIPDVRSGRPAPKKAKEGGAATPAFNKNLTPADGKQAAVQILAARRALDSADKLVSAGDFAALQSLLSAAPVSAFEDNALVLVQSKALGLDDVKQIGTIKRYGVGADVIIMLGGLEKAVDDKNAANAKSFLDKAKASLDEIVTICKANKLV